ncbi:hypothetical protein C1E24_18250 [Pseudoalteromonas phenolica]|uniref:Uncharacterized protein n=1 Tax=Pseudoalteromonas phenolica TaxID=161398 RepID=A0A5R9PX95_9GAMM|nr:hypothetical protein [Pseudoalteromonas phenolica]TLX45533.1 hypothetical protein C1E24_18250 [Pseudoalteromonas phenolica]
MTKTVSQSKKIALVAILAVAAVGYYGYSKVSYARTVASEIEKITPFKDEKLALDSVDVTDKNFTLALKVSGITSELKNIDEFKSHYDEVALNYICQSSNYDAQFEEGYHINMHIKYQDEPDKTFSRIYVSKEQCSELNI